LADGLLDCRTTILLASSPADLPAAGSTSSCPASRHTGLPACWSAGILDIQPYGITGFLTVSLLAFQAAFLTACWTAACCHDSLLACRLLAFPLSCQPNPLTARWTASLLAIQPAGLPSCWSASLLDFQAAGLQACCPAHLMACQHACMPAC
jgi:hypothetical protein